MEVPAPHKLLTPAEEVSDFVEQLHTLADEAGKKVDSINFDPDGIEKGMAKLVLTIMELLYQLMERQAIKRIDGDSLTEEEVERLGLAFMKIDAQIEDMVQLFGLDREDLNLDLGPLGNLI